SAISTVSRLTRDGQTFGKQHHRKIAVALRGIAKAFAAGGSENHVRFTPESGHKSWPRLGSVLGVQLPLPLCSTNSAKDRTVANVRWVVFLQPLGHFPTDRQIRQMVRRPRCAPQFNRSLSCPLAIWLLGRSLRCGHVGDHLAIKPVDKILFDDRKY